MNKYFNGLLLVFMWLLVWMFSHDYVSQGINDRNQTRADLIADNRLNYQWSFQGDEDIVTSFRGDWSVTKQGVTSLVKQPEISLYMNGNIIDPKLHGFLQLGFEEMPASGTFKIEVSDQRKRLFFDSPNLAMESKEQTLSLSGLTWYPNDSSSSNHAPVEKSWQELGTLDALVIRFYFDEPDRLTLKSVGIKQNAENPTPGQQPVACVSLTSSTWGCHVSNHMVYLNQNRQRTDLTQHLIINPVSDLPPIWWLLLAAVVGLILAGNFRSKEQAGTAYRFGFDVLGLTLTVLVVVWCLSQSWLLPIGDYIMTLMVVMFVVLFFVYIDSFKWPAQSAVPVWLISLILGAILWFVSGESFGYLNQFPSYFLWACLQQLVLGPVVSTFVYQRTGQSKLVSACYVGVLFSMIHAPNHSLMLATLVSGIAWSFSWLHFKNLYANSFSHALLALTFYQAMPVMWLGSARVGVFFIS